MHFFENSFKLSDCTVGGKLFNFVLQCMMTIKGILILILIELLSVLLHYISGLYVEKQLVTEREAA